jgi:hypothetical protein
MGWLEFWLITSPYLLFLILWTAINLRREPESDRVITLIRYNNEQVELRRQAEARLREAHKVIERLDKDLDRVCKELMATQDELLKMKGRP